MKGFPYSFIPAIKLVDFHSFNQSNIFSMLLNCYGIEETEDVSRFCIYETGHGFERKCNENEKPLTIQSDWTNNSKISGKPGETKQG